MGDNADKKLDSIFAAARADQEDTTALEEHFETRLMARIAERNRSGVPWYMLAWRMIPACSGIALLCAVCSVTFNPVRSTDVFTAITVGHEDLITTSYMLGE